MNKDESNNKIIDNLYSRQIGTIGKEAMNHLMKLKVLILGMRGNGIEIAKNTVLLGVNQVTIYDSALVTLNDLGSNFYIEKKDIKNRRDESVLKKLKDLNPHTHVDRLQLKSEESLEEFLLKLDFKYNVIVQTEFISEKKILKLSEYCHSNNINFIYGVVFGLNAFIFNDFGEDFTILDSDGKEPQRYHCKNLTNEEKCVMTLEEGEVSFEQNDKIIFKLVEGMTDLNNLKEPAKILEVKTDENKKKSFVLDINSTSFGKYKAGGLVYKPKETTSKKFKSFKESTSIPFVRKNNEEYFTAKEENEDFLYNERYNLSIILAIGKYLNNQNNLPELGSIGPSEEIANIAEDLFIQMKKHDEEMNIKYDTSEEEIKKFIKSDVINMLEISRAEIAPMCSIIGGMISQEIMKTIGKYEPIYQWDFFDLSFVKPAEKKKRNSFESPYKIFRTNSNFWEKISRKN